MDDKTVRRRIEDLQDEVKRQPAAAYPGGPALVKTAVKTAYPTTASSCFYCQVCSLGGAEVEDGAGVITPIPNRFLYAFNIGTAVPPLGTVLTAHCDRHGTWTIRYD